MSLLETVVHVDGECGLVLETVTQKSKLSIGYQRGAHEDNPQIPAERVSHNITEKEYRSTLNDKFAALKARVPNLKSKTRCTKGEIKSQTTKYIRSLEKENRELVEEGCPALTQIVDFVMTDVTLDPLAVTINPMQQYF